MGYGTGKTVVGLDIEPGFVAAVQGRSGQPVIERAAVGQLAPGVMRDGEVADVDLLAGALHDLFGRNKLAKRVRLGVANQRIVMRTVDLPPLRNSKEIESAVRFQAQEHIPMPLEQVVLEYQSLGVKETPDGPRTRVVLVAARRDAIERLLQATRSAGLRPRGVDLSAFAMVRALHRSGSTEPTLYISVGGITNLAVAVGSTCVFTRVVTSGSESMASELAERRGLILEHAHGWLKHVGMVQALEEIEGDREIVAEARTVLGEGIARIADEVRNSLDFHTMQTGTTAVASAVLTGPAVAIPGFSEHLAREVGMPLRAGVANEARQGACGGIDPGSLTVAAGLTVEEVPA